MLAEAGERPGTRDAGRDTVLALAEWDGFVPIVKRVGCSPQVVVGFGTLAIGHAEVFPRHGKRRLAVQRGRQHVDRLPVALENVLGLRRSCRNLTLHGVGAPEVSLILDDIRIHLGKPFQDSTRLRHARFGLGRLPRFDAELSQIDVGSGETRLIMWDLRPIARHRLADRHGIAHRLLRVLQIVFEEIDDPQLLVGPGLGDLVVADVGVLPAKLR